MKKVIKLATHSQRRMKSFSTKKREMGQLKEVLEMIGDKQLKRQYLRHEFKIQGKKEQENSND